MSSVRLISRLVLGTLVASILVAGATPPSQAGSPHAGTKAHHPPPRLVLTAERTGVVDLRLPRVDLDWSFLKLRGRAKHVAIFLEPLGLDPARGAGVLVSPGPGQSIGDAPAMSLRSDDFFVAQGGGPRQGARASLSPGRYRVHVLTDGPVTLDFPVYGLGHTVRAAVTHRGGDGFVATDVALSGATPVQKSGRVSARLPQPHDVIALAAVSVTYRQQQAGDDSFDACIVHGARDRGGDCSRGVPSAGYSQSDSYTYGADPAAAPDVTTTIVSYYDRSAPPTGHLLATVSATDRVRRATALGLVLAIHHQPGAA